MSDTPRTDAFISELRVRHFNECEAPGIAAMHAWKFNEVQEFARQLERELAEAQRDAERYRFIRSCRDAGFWQCHEKDGEGGSILRYEEDLDAAIDKARGE